MIFAVVGDIHHAWDQADVAWFDASDCDAVLFTGDLAGYRHRDTLAVAERIGRLRKPALLVPGNHDGPRVGQMVAELLGSALLGRAFAGGLPRRADAAAAKLGAVEVGGYSRHRFGDLDVVVGRPHSMGGPTLTFPHDLRARHGIESMESSAERLRALVDGCGPRLLFLAHNGPAGLGATRDAPWGRDFHRDEGDWGDADLRAAVEHARATGRTVVAVVAGHMHRRMRGGGQRRWQADDDGTLCLNAAVVPRHRADGARHHVRLVIDGDQATAEDVWVGR